MKRLSLIIMMLATLSGVFAPVGASLISGGGVAYGVSVAHAVTPAEEAAANAAKSNITTNISCGTGLFGNGSLGGCIATIVYYLVYSLGGLVLEQSAKLLDVTATYTLSSKLYSASSFINDGWRITRDFANIAFIFILLVIALSLIIGIDIGGNPKRMLAMVILIALLINFSMFITKLVIDASNTTALLFYNQIAVKDLNGNMAVSESTTKITASTGIEPRPIAAALAQAFQPQVFQDAKFFDGLKGYEEDGPRKDLVDPSKMIFVLLMVGIMFWVAAYSFFIAALSFMGRIVMLMVSIIFAPIAFITFIVPSLSKHKELGWSAWWSNLFGIAFSAPIYFFFILLISIMAQSKMITDITAASGNSMMILTTLFISFMILIVMLNKATAFAKKASGEIGEKIANFGGGIVTGIGAAAGGFALGTMTGGAALLGQKTLGRVSQRIANSDTLHGAAAIEGGGFMNSLKRFTAQQAIKGSRQVSGASFNLGATTVGQKLASGLGVKMTSAGNLAQKNLAGGYEVAEKRKWEKKEAFSKSLQGDVKAQAKINEDLQKNASAFSDAEKKLTAEMDREAKARKTFVEAKEKEDQANTTVKNTQAEHDAAKAEYDKQRGEDALNGLTTDSPDTVAAKTAFSQKQVELQKATADAATAKTTTSDAEKNLTDTKKDVDIKKKSISDDKVILAREKKDLEKDLEVQKNARAKAYMYNEYNKTGYAVVGTKRDSKTGLITDAGQIDIRQNARGWKKASLQNPVGLGARAAAGALVGSVVPGVGTVVGAGVGLAAGLGSGVLNNLRANFNVAAGEIVGDALSLSANGLRTNTAGVRRTVSSVVTSVRNAGSALQSAYRNAATNSTP